MSNSKPKKRSLSKQIEEAAKGIAVKPRKNIQVVVDSSSSSSSDEDDEVELHDDAIAQEIGQRAEAEEQQARSAKQKKKKKRKSAPKKRTSVVHHLYEASPQKDGVFLCKLHEFAKPGDKHPQEVKQSGKQTSNLLDHARKYHSDVVEGLIKAYNEGRDVGAEFAALCQAMTPPKPQGMDRFVSLVKRSEILLRRQLSLLSFIISNQLPFNIVESSEFRSWMVSLQVDYPSAATLKKLLAPFHEVVVKEIEDSLREAGFFSTTFDLWTSNAGNKYCVVTYHSMDDKFNLLSAPLDLIPMDCSAFGEFIYLAIDARLEAHHFSDCVHIASFSDSGSNVVLAKGLLTPGDAEPCFNHDLKHVVEDVLVGSDSLSPCCPRAAKDFTALSLMIMFIRGSNPLTSLLSSKMRLFQPGTRKLKLVQINLTRWEGRYTSLKRVIELREGLTSLHEEGVLGVLLQKHHGSFPEDFLLPPFWRRLTQIYEPLLEVCHTASKVAQRSTTPVLSCIPHQVHLIERACIRAEDDSDFAAEFKTAFLEVVKVRLSKYVLVQLEGGGDAHAIPNAIKAALLDPRYSSFVQEKLGPDETKAACDAIVADTLHLFPEEAPLNAIQQQMDMAFPSLLKKLASAGEVKPEEVSKWWQATLEDDAKVGSLWQNFGRSARMFLSMPAGGAPSEVAFSDTTATVTKKRNLIGDRTLEQVTVLRRYIMSQKFDMDALIDKIRVQATTILEDGSGSASEDEDEYE